MKTKLLFMFLFLLTLSLAAQTVYVTKTGSKYHTAGCRYLRSSSIPMALSDAIKYYSPCSVCKPPVKVKKEAEVKKTQEVKSSVSTETYNGKTIYTGPRGGKYYINKNGNKTYIKRK